MKQQSNEYIFSINFNCIPISNTEPTIQPSQTITFQIGGTENPIVVMNEIVKKVLKITNLQSRKTKKQSTHNQTLENTIKMLNHDFEEAKRKDPRSFFNKVIH